MPTILRLASWVRDGSAGNGRLEEHGQGALDESGTPVRPLTAARHQVSWIADQHVLTGIQGRLYPEGDEFFLLVPIRLIIHHQSGCDSATPQELHLMGAWFFIPVGTAPFFLIPFLCFRLG